MFFFRMKLILPISEFTSCFRLNKQIEKIYTLGGSISCI